MLLPGGFFRNQFINYSTAASQGVRRTTIIPEHLIEAPTSDGPVVYTPDDGTLVEKLPFDPATQTTLTHGLLFIVVFNFPARYLKIKINKNWSSSIVRVEGRQRSSSFVTGQAVDGG
jgi:hypothetical protein